MVVVIFRSRLREDYDQQEYAAINARMGELATAMPGFISAKDFEASDGERVSIIEFESEETIGAWREHFEHSVAQKRGRDSFYKEFSVQVCVPTRSYKFDASKHA